MKIIVDTIGNVLLQLREGSTASQQPAEVIIDLSRQGNWIRGFEMTGGMFAFSLRKAVAPFHPRALLLGAGGENAKLEVTYDAEADAAYFYLPYGSRYRALSAKDRDMLTQYSHSINPTSTCALDAGGGLISVLVPTADATGPVETFLGLFDTERRSSPFDRS